MKNNMNSKKIFTNVAVIAFFAATGFFVSYYTTPSGAGKNTAAVGGGAGPTTPDLVIHADEMSPDKDAQGDYPYVNKARLAKLAGGGRSYKGPSYKEGYVEAQKMVAERQIQKNRIPASQSDR